MIKNLIIVDETHKVTIPRVLKKNQNIFSIPNKKSYIVTYENNSERMFGGKFIKLVPIENSEWLFVSSSISKEEFKELIYNNFSFKNLI